MFKVKIGILIFMLCGILSAKERVSGRSLAIVMPIEEIKKELGVDSLGAIKKIYQDGLTKFKKGSPERNRLLLYRDSLNLKESARTRVNIYHEDTYSKKWERFKNRLYRGFNLRTLMELFSFLLIFIAVTNKVKTKPRSTIRKEKYSFTGDLFSNEDFLKKMREFNKKEAHLFKNKIVKIIRELNFLFSDHDHLKVDFRFHKNRFFLMVDLEHSLDNELKNKLGEFSQVIVNDINFQGSRIEQITQLDQTQRLVLSMEVLTENRHLKSSF